LPGDLATRPVEQRLELVWLEGVAYYEGAGLLLDAAAESLGLLVVELVQ
jgi:hypothetical protein